MHGVDFAQEKMNLLNISSVSVSMSRITAVRFSLSAILQISMCWFFFFDVLFKKKVGSTDAIMFQAFINEVEYDHFCRIAKVKFQLKACWTQVFFFLLFYFFFFLVQWYWEF